MQIMEPIDELADWTNGFPKEAGESGQPQVLSDSSENLAKMLDRQRVTYEPVWQAVEGAAPKWVPVLCNSYRRAVLLASSAIQHRTAAYDVWRRGRLVCIRLIARPESRTA